MAKPTNHLPSLAPPDPDSPSSSHSVANHPTCPKLESAMAAAPKLSTLSRLHNQALVSSQRLKSSNPSPLMAVSSMIKSKPHLQKFASCGDETSSKKEANEELDDGKALFLVVKEKELKGLQKGHRPDSMRPTVSLLRKGGRTKSFAASQVELVDIFAKNGMKVVSVDMPPAMQIHAVDCARKAHDSMEKFTSKALALSLKREFDGAYGPVWHCIVGTSFGSFVTHSVGGFLYLSMDQRLYVLLFKTSVQRAD